MSCCLYEDRFSGLKTTTRARSQIENGLNKRQEPIILLPSIKLWFWYHATPDTLTSNFVENVIQRNETKIFVAQCVEIEI